MKKKLLGVAIFTLILASCQKSEIVDGIDAGNNQLTFGVYQGKVTKAAELTNTDLKTDGLEFPLYAYKGKQVGVKTPYFKDALTYSTGTSKWTTSIPRFLTESVLLQFYAYYPDTGVTDYAEALGSNDYPSFKYTIQKNKAAVPNPNGTEIDLVAAAVNDHSGTSVKIPFKHILSQINFGVKGYYGAKIAISNIVVNDVKNGGTFTYNPTNGAWTDPSGEEDYTYTFPTFVTPGSTGKDGDDWTDENDEQNIRYVFGDGGKWGPGKGATIWYITADNTAKLSTEVEDTDKLSNALMLMPQELTSGMADAYVTFDYTIQDLEDSYVVGGPLATNVVPGKFDLNMGNKEDPNLAYQNKWEPNLRYLYVIDFTGYLDGQKLTFDVDVESQPWENYNPDNGNDGVVLLSSLGEPIFSTSIKPLNPGDTYSTLKGNVFSNIAWNWSPYTMAKNFAKGNDFKVTFAGVKFNGNKITITAPFGFEVKNDGSLDFTASAEATTAGTMLTFRSLRDGYYADAVTLNTAIIADKNYEFYASNSIKLSDLDAKVLTTVTTVDNTVIIHFVTPYAGTLPSAKWKLSDENKTVTFTAAP